MNAKSPRGEDATLRQAQLRIEQLSEELSSERERLLQLELHLDIALRANQRLRDRRHGEGTST